MLERNDDSLSIEFLGHNSWFVKTNFGSFLIDPLLLSDFGNSKIRPFKLHPQQALLREDHLLTNDVIITHEHSDHIDLKSLSLLKINTRIHVGPTFPEYLVDSIQDNGYKVIRHFYGHHFNICGALICLYPCDPATAFWEQRVSQILISTNDYFEGSIFMAVDALISLDYLMEINSGFKPRPTAVVVSNNSYIMPSGQFGPLDNILGNNNPNGLVGLELIHELTAIAKIISDSKIIVAGGGIRRFDEILHWPFSSQKELEHLCKILSPSLDYFAPNQGDFLTLTKNEVKAIINDNISYKTDKKAKPPHFEPIITESVRSISDCWEIIDKETPTLILALSMSYISDYWWKSEISKPYYAAFVIFGNNINEIEGVLLFSAVDPKVEKIRIENFREATDLVPFGLGCFIQDITSVISGEIEIWDIVGKSIKCWHPPEFNLHNMTSFLYAYFGEQTRPELAKLCLSGK